VSGVIKNKDKIAGILQKFDDYYHITESKDERYRRYNKGYSVSVIHLLQIGESLVFIIMTKQNIVKGLFFEREKYADARDKKHRINLNECYEFVRVNKEVFDPVNKQLIRTNEVWTVDITEKEKQAIITSFNQALIKRNYMVIKQICYGLHHFIGFSAVRTTYLELKEILERRFAEFHRSQFEARYTCLDELYRLPKKISYVKFMKNEMLTVEFIK